MTSFHYFFINYKFYCVFVHFLACTLSCDNFNSSELDSRRRWNQRSRSVQGFTYVPGIGRLKRLYVQGDVIHKLPMVWVLRCYGAVLVIYIDPDVYTCLEKTKTNHHSGQVWFPMSKQFWFPFNICVENIGESYLFCVCVCVCVLSRKHQITRTF